MSAENQMTIGYKKDQDAKEITVTLKSPTSMTILDVLRGLTSVVNQILMTGKY